MWHDEAYALHVLSLDLEHVLVNIMASQGWMLLVHVSPTEQQNGEAKESVRFNLFLNKEHI